MGNEHPTGHMCPVCGYADLDKPAYSRGNVGSPSFEYCPSCGFQFGWTDDDQQITHEQWHEKWIAKGTPWDNEQIEKPFNWNPREQLLNVGVKL